MNEVEVAVKLSENFDILYVTPLRSLYIKLILIFSKGNAQS